MALEHGDECRGGAVTQVKRNVLHAVLAVQGFDGREVAQALAPDKKGQQVDLWLAPSLEWYPVKVTFADEDGDYVEQTLQKIVKK